MKVPDCFSFFPEISGVNHNLKWLFHVTIHDFISIIYKKEIMFLWLLLYKLTKH